MKMNHIRLNMVKHAGEMKFHMAVIKVFVINPEIVAVQANTENGKAVMLRNSGPDNAPVWPEPSPAKTVTASPWLPCISVSA